MRSSWLVALSCLLGATAAQAQGTTAPGSAAQAVPSAAPQAQPQPEEDVWEEAESLKAMTPGEKKADLTLRSSLFCSYKPNYFVAGLYDGAAQGRPTTRFQVSFRNSIASFHSNGHSGCQTVRGAHHFFFAYTVKVLWNLWAASAPFDESNHNPELYWEHTLPQRWLGMTDLRLGLEHESNGEDGERSRAWNRLYFAPRFQWFPNHRNVDAWLNEVRFVPRLWWILPLEFPPAREQVRRSLGFGELRLDLARRRRGEIAGEMVGFVADVTLAIGDHFDRASVLAGVAVDLPYRFLPALYVQGFHGYGETLLRAPRKDTQLRAGVQLLEY
jgi:outer membrane phospholipase A